MRSKKGYGELLVLLLLTRETMSYEIRNEIRNEIRESVRGNPGFTPVDTGDNEPEVSVNGIRERVWGTPGLPQLTQETINWLYIA